jgi:hypothetical protein
VNAGRSVGVWSIATQSNNEVGVAHILGNFFVVSIVVEQSTDLPSHISIPWLPGIDFYFQSPILALEKLYLDASFISRWSIRHLISPHQATRHDRQGPPSLVP